MREALRGRRRVHVVWLAAGAPGDDLGHALAGVAGGRRGSAPDIRHASAAQLTALAGSPDHQGIVAAVDPYPVRRSPRPSSRTSRLLVALDEVQDPHNLGAIIRTAEGAGAGVVIPRHRAAEVTAAVVKASAGATEHAAIAQVRNLADFLGAAKEAGFWVYGAAAGATSAYTAQDYRYPTCFVVGSEGQGLGRRVESLCDVIVSLPLQGKVDSLNVSVSTGILLYEAVRQRRAAGAGGRGRGPDGAADGRAPARPGRDRRATDGDDVLTVFLIDGYNVLHQMVGHRQLAGGGDFRGHQGRTAATSRHGPGRVPFGRGDLDLEDARKRLLDRIASYMGRTSDRAIVVFDSHAQMLQKQESATANVEVYFGSFSHSADSIIEREAFAASAGENVVVVSSDYQLQKTIFRPNVIRRSSRQFVSDLQEETKSIAISPNCTTMSHRIEDRVDSGDGRQAQGASRFAEREAERKAEGSRERP